MANTDIGYLVVAVSDARGAFPVEGAQVRIYSTNEGDAELLYTLSTDESGRTPDIELPAPPFEASQTPDSGVVPYALYTIDTDYDGYYSVQNINAPVFPGIRSIQNVALVPITANQNMRVPYDDTRFNESTVPDL